MENTDINLHRAIVKSILAIITLDSKPLLCAFRNIINEEI